MNVQLEKRKLMEWLANINDEAVISKLHEIQSGFTSSSDWDDVIFSDEKFLINKGLNQIEKGEVLTHH